jgi:hypothetical protein
MDLLGFAIFSSGLVTVKASFIQTLLAITTPLTIPGAHTTLVNMQSVVGHWIWALLIRRSFLSIVETTYSWMNSWFELDPSLMNSSQQVPGAVVSELKVLLFILPFLAFDAKVPLAQFAVATDASNKMAGATIAPITSSQSLQLCELALRKGWNQFFLTGKTDPASYSDHTHQDNRSSESNSGDHSASSDRENSSSTSSNPEFLTADKIFDKVLSSCLPVSDQNSDPFGSLTQANQFQSPFSSDATSDSDSSVGPVIIHNPKPGVVYDYDDRHGYRVVPPWSTDLYPTFSLRRPPGEMQRDIRFPISELRPDRGVYPIQLSNILIDLNWSVTLSHPFQFPEHINLLELQAYLLALRGLVFNKGFRLHRCRLPMLVDSTAALGALVKGRSSFRKANRILRKVAAISVIGEIYTQNIWVPTDINPADAPSRIRMATTSVIPIV